MIVELGAFAAILALVLSLMQGGLGLSGAQSLPRAQAASSCAQAAALCSALAFACLIYAFVRSDFSLAVVTANSHSDKPLIYKIAGAWGNHEGSMLLWCLVSASFGAILGLARGAPSARLMVARARRAGLGDGGRVYLHVDLVQSVRALGSAADARARSQSALTRSSARGASAASVLGLCRPFGSVLDGARGAHRRQCR